MKKRVWFVFVMILSLSAVFAGVKIFLKSGKVINLDIDPAEIEKIVFEEQQKSENNYADKMLSQLYEMKKETILFEDFETTPAGEGILPPGFEVLYSGREYGVSSGEVPAASGKNVLKVWGMSGWNANIAYPVNIPDYYAVEFRVKIFAPKGKAPCGRVMFLEKEKRITHMWNCGGIGPDKDGFLKLKINGEEKLYKLFKTNSWNEVRSILFYKDKYGMVFVNSKLIYEYWLLEDGYSLKFKFHFPEETYETEWIPPSDIMDPNVFYRLGYINFYDPECEDDIPTYFDDFVVIGYKR